MVFREAAWVFLECFKKHSRVSKEVLFCDFVFAVIAATQAEGGLVFLSFRSPPPTLPYCTVINLSIFLSSFDVTL